MSGSKAIPLEGQVGSSPNHLDMPELLFAVCATGKTGRLVLHAGDVEKSVFLSDGQVVFAASSSPDDRLGAYMLQQNELALDDLRRLSPQVRPGVRLGTLLVQNGLVPSSDLARAVGGQIKAIVLSLFGWTHVAYAFLEEPSGPGRSVKDEAIRLTIPTARLIVDGIDRVPSWERIVRGSARSTSASGSWAATWNRCVWRISIPRASSFSPCLPFSIRDPRFQGKDLIDLFDGIDLEPEQIVLEVTESDAIDNFPLFVNAMKDFMDLRCLVAIDDMGAGYSGLDKIVHQLREAYPVRDGG